MGNPNNDLNKKINKWLLFATISVFLFVCLAIIVIIPTEKSNPNSIKPITDLSYFEIRNNQKTMTGVQWDQYVKSIMGNRVQWHGFVDEIKQDISGTNFIWIDMDNPPDAVSDVYFEYPEEKSLKYSKGQLINFQGDFDGGIEIIFFEVELEDAEILN